MRNVSGLEAVYRDYGPRGVKFFFVYKSLAHPELEGRYVQPFTFDERLAHARQAVKQLGATIPWIVDPMDNRMKHALGDRANSEYVIDPSGKVVRKRPWSNPIEVRKDLEELVGKVDTITLPENLNLVTLPPLMTTAAKDVVPPLPRPGMFPLMAEPRIEPGEKPFYAKLRCEAELKVIDDGKGKLYLGFHLDPFHGAHWNNLVTPLRFELDCPANIAISPQTGVAPKVDVDADIDPREFMLDVESWPNDAVIRVTVSYAACTDETCHMVRQEYAVHRQRDRDGGRAAGAGFRVVSVPDMIKLLLEGDKNGDGKLTREELNSVKRQRFDDFDLNKDGILDKDEIRIMADQESERKES